MSLRMYVFRNWSSSDFDKFFACLNTRLAVGSSDSFNTKWSVTSLLLFTKPCCFYNISIYFQSFLTYGLDLYQIMCLPGFSNIWGAFWDSIDDQLLLSFLAFLEFPQISSLVRYGTSNCSWCRNFDSNLLQVAVKFLHYFAITQFLQLFHSLL